MASAGTRAAGVALLRRAAAAAAAGAASCPLPSRPAATCPPRAWRPLQVRRQLEEVRAEAAAAEARRGALEQEIAALQRELEGEGRAPEAGAPTAAPPDDEAAAAAPARAPNGGYPSPAAAAAGEDGGQPPLAEALDERGRQLAVAGAACKEVGARIQALEAKLAKVEEGYRQADQVGGGACVRGGVFAPGA